MSIFALHILPPLAIGRLGSAPEPLDNYTLEENPEHPLDFRTIKPAKTLIVDEMSGEILKARTPKTITFKQDGRIRPVAPFLEVFAQTDADPNKPLQPLTLDLLKQHRLSPKDVKWQVIVANRKVVRRTCDPKDLVITKRGWFSSHEPRRLEGYCKNFISPKRFIDFGRVRYIKPNKEFPQIRLRFTPAQGVIYGPNIGNPKAGAEATTYHVPKEHQIYDRRKSWYQFQVSPPGEITDVIVQGGDPPKEAKQAFYNDTLPPALFAIDPPAPSWLHGNVAISRGYLDDACDGFVEVALKLRNGTRLKASARITAGPPVVVVDSLFVRNLADDLEQVIEGPNVSDGEPYEVIRGKAEDIIRRSYETVRFLNIAVMNGNPVQGRPALTLDTMPAEEAFDTERLERPVMAPATVDTLAVLQLHQQVFAALRSGAMPWFLRLLRLPEQAADYTDEGRRKMPALMCGADNNYLALTRRQIDTIRAASDALAFTPNLTWSKNRSDPPKSVAGLTPRNRTALVNYAAAGNPVSSRPVHAIANCCPGLEVDFRAVWRRVFKGLVLREYDNLVIDIDPKQDDPGKLKLKGHRLLRVNGVNVMTQKIGPSPADRFESVVLSTTEDPDAVQPLEWSNALANILHDNAGKLVTCDFTKEAVWEEQVWWPDKQDTEKSGKEPPHISFQFRLRPFFDGDTAVISKALAEVGELTQGLCSPWQNDYRECSCYYWASARPDYVNVEPSANGTSQGDNWLQKERTGQYVPDDYVDSRMILYDDLFKEWEKWLRVQVRGQDVPDKPERKR